MREGAAPASRAPLGRPPAAPPPSPEVKNELSRNNKQNDAVEPVSVNPDQPVEPAPLDGTKLQTTRPIRQTRNQNPRYVDFLALAA